MNDWSPFSFFIWLAAAILLPGLIAHFTLGRNGGHRLFEKEGLSAREIRGLPSEMIRKRSIWNLKGAAAALIGLVAAMALYPLSCLIGLPVNVLGLSDEQLVYYAAAVFVLLLTLGPALYRRWRED